MQVSELRLKLSSKLSAPAGEVKPTAHSETQRHTGMHNFHSAIVFRLALSSAAPDRSEPTIIGGNAELQQTFDHGIM